LDLEFDRDLLLDHFHPIIEKQLRLGLFQKY
jgi:hypothetical protein